MEADIERTKNNENREYWLNVGADYSIQKNMAATLYAGYQFDHDIDDENEVANHRDYKIGVEFKIEF